MIRHCPTCGCSYACYNDEHAADELTEIPEESWLLETATSNPPAYASRRVFCCMLVI